MNTTTETKRGRGRPKNSVTLQNVKLSDLIEKYGPDTILPVGRLWLKNQANYTVGVDPSQNESQTHSSVQVISTNNQPRVLGLVNEEPKIKFSLVD